MNWTDQGAKVYCSSSLSNAVFYTTPTPTEHPHMLCGAWLEGKRWAPTLGAVELYFDLHLTCTCDAVIKCLIEDMFVKNENSVNDSKLRSLLICVHLFFILKNIINRKLLRLKWTNIKLISGHTPYHVKWDFITCAVLDDYKYRQLLCGQWRKVWLSSDHTS